MTDLFLLLGYSSNIFQYVVLDSSGNGQEENMLIFKAPQKTRDHKMSTLRLPWMPEVFSLASWSVRVSSRRLATLRRSILSPPTRKNPWHPGYSTLNEGATRRRTVFSTSESNPVFTHSVSGRSYVIRLFVCLRSLVSCKRAAHLTSFLRKTRTIITEIQNALVSRRKTPSFWKFVNSHKF